MHYLDMQAQSQQNPQQPWGIPPFGQLGIPAMNSLGQAAYGPFAGQSGAPGFGQQNLGGWAGQGGWGQPQRQLSHQDVNEVVRQLAPLP